MSDFILIIISTALVNNIIVEQVIGADPALAFTRKFSVAFGLIYTMIILLPLATVCAYIIDTYVLVPLDVQYLRLLVFISVILLLALCLKQWGNKVNDKLGELFNIFMPLAAINTAVLGTLLLNQQYAHGLWQSFIFGLGSSLGFALILLMLTAINERLQTADVPAPFRGMSITLITLGLISMAFLGFVGLSNI
jgi:electron transport complex protein RnfA